MIITTKFHTATDHIGSRVVATSDQGHRAVELYDWNKTSSTNHRNAAEQIAPVPPLAVNDYGQEDTTMVWEV